MNPDELAALEEERRFLLRSLTDLDREYEAGDVDQADYESLRDGYTARAAVVLKAIDHGRQALPNARRRPPLQMAGWIVGTLLVAVLLGWLLASRSGPRADGQTITGGQPMDEISAKLAEARANLGTDAGVAADAYIAVLKADPGNVEALTYSGWLLVQQGRGANQELVTLGIRNMREAIAIDSTYADAHCFLALTSANHLQPADLDTARSEAQACLDNHPPAQMVGMIQSFLDRLDTTPST